MSKYLALDGDKRILTSSKKRGGGERGRRGERRQGLGERGGAAAGNILQISLQALFTGLESGKILWTTLKFPPLLRMSFLTFSRTLELGLRSTSILNRVDQYQEFEQVITHYDLIYLPPHLWKMPPEW